MTGADVADSASRTPGTARMGPIETTGLDGASRTTSAPAMASTTPGAATADPIPGFSNPAGSSVARCLVHHSWKCIRDPSRSCTTVSTSASVIGSSRAPSGQRRDIRSITCVGVSPSRSHPVRARCVPRSRSPRVNHGHPAPHSWSSWFTRSLSPARPHPLIVVVHSGQRVHDGVDIGLEPHPRQPQIVAGVDDDRQRLGGVGDAARAKGSADAEREAAIRPRRRRAPPPGRTRGSRGEFVCGVGQREPADGVDQGVHRLGVGDHVDGRGRHAGRPWRCADRSRRSASSAAGGGTARSPGRRRSRS